MKMNIRTVLKCSLIILFSCTPLNHVPVAFERRKRRFPWLYGCTIPGRRNVPFFLQEVKRSLWMAILMRYCSHKSVRRHSKVFLEQTTVRFVIWSRKLFHGTCSIASSGSNSLTYTHVPRFTSCIRFFYARNTKQHVLVIFIRHF